MKAETTTKNLDEQDPGSRAHPDHQSILRRMKIGLGIIALGILFDLVFSIYMLATLRYALAIISAVCALVCIFILRSAFNSFKISTHLINGIQHMERLRAQDEPK